MSSLLVFLLLAPCLSFLLPVSVQRGRGAPHLADLSNRVLVLETKQDNIETRLAEIKNDIGEVRKEISKSNEKLSKEIGEVRKEIRESNEKLSKEMRESNEKLFKEIRESNEKIMGRFTFLYVFLAAFVTATGMANYKDFSAFFK